MRQRPQIEILSTTLTHSLSFPRHISNVLLLFSSFTFEQSVLYNNLIIFVDFDNRQTGRQQKTLFIQNICGYFMYFCLPPWYTKTQNCLLYPIIWKNKSLLRRVASISLGWSIFCLRFGTFIPQLYLPMFSRDVNNSKRPISFIHF